MPDGFDILFREGPCIVVNKPGGVLTQAAPHIDSMERRIKAYLKDQENKTGNVYLGMPHRLDRPVSGALVVARHVRAARRISKQFEARSVRKVYWCLVEGLVDPAEGAWEDNVRKIPNVARAEVLEANHPEAKVARLRYRVLRYMQHPSPQTFLQIELETGRTHQIRLQASHRGHPVVGDELYGALSLFGPEFTDRRDRWIALHARLLCLEHPMTRQELEVAAPLPAWWPEELREQADPS